MKSQIITAAILGLAITAGGCTSATSRQAGKLVADAYATKAEIENDKASEKTAIASPDGAVQIMVPSTWSAVPLTESDQDLILKVTDAKGRVQLGIQSFPKQDQQGYMSEQAISEAAAGMAKAATADGTVAPTSVTTVNGLPAVQYEGRGELGGYSIVSLATAIDGPEAYYSILAVVEEKDYDSMRDSLDQIVQSFQPQQPGQ